MLSILSCALQQPLDPLPQSTHAHGPLLSTFRNPATTSVILCSVCDEQQHWRELTHLYIAYDEYDNAATTMMAHSPIAWEHVQFKDVCVKVSSSEVSQHSSATFQIPEF